MFYLCEIFLDTYSAKYNFTFVVIISKTGFLTFTPCFTNLVIVSEIKVAFSKLCQVVRISLVESRRVKNMNEGGWEVFRKKWWTCCFFYERSDGFVIVLLCACVQPAFSESRRAFAYAFMLWWQICQKWISNNLQDKVKKLWLLKKGFYETYFHNRTAIFQSGKFHVVFAIS